MTIKILQEENSRTALWENVTPWSEKSKTTPQYIAAFLGKQ